jgi:hypothetical protein
VNNAPHRVHTTVSPPRLASQDPGQMSLKHVIPSQSTPNSQHTPHVMVRRSARQQNVYKDMMAKTMTQANRCFSISAQTKYTHQENSNTDMINLPEMANAVIFPDTGKSLNHQELITKLKYKIKWMKSTSNDITRLHNTNTIRFISRSDIPKGRKVIYC